jgi:ERCC4-type nuclease
MTYHIIVDSREQQPWTFDRLNVETTVEKLDMGDYTLAGYEHAFAVDRKSLDDLVGSVNPTSGRDRFHRLIKKSRSLYKFAVVIEDTERALINGDYYSGMHPNAVKGTITAWSDAYNVEFIFADSRENAQLVTLNLLQQWQDEVSHSLM